MHLKQFCLVDIEITKFNFHFRKSMTDQSEESEVQGAFSNWIESIIDFQKQMAVFQSSVEDAIENE
jgi:hypothetical protein